LVEAKVSIAHARVAKSIDSREYRRMDADKKMTVLIADDSSQTLEVIAYNLRVAGYEVTTAGDGKEAMMILKSKNTFDVVISDIHMPNMDGFALSKFVATLKPKPYFFLMTADNDINEWDAIDKGADGLFKKPFDGSRLTVKLAVLQRTKAKKT
jgi:CheY-like chemotaxis protein